MRQAEAAAQPRRGQLTSEANAMMHVCVGPAAGRPIAVAAAVAVAASEMANVFICRQ